MTTAAPRTPRCRTIRVERSSRGPVTSDTGTTRRAPATGLARARGHGAKLASALPLLLIVALWQLAFTMEMWPPQVLVAPAAIWETLVDMLRSGELQRHVGASLYRLALGFSCGSAAGLTLGTAMALSRLFNRLFAPTFQVFRQVPVIAFIPLLILFFDVEDSFKIVVVSAAAFFPVALATSDAIAAVPRSHFEVGALYRMPLAALIARVILPATIPSVLTGIRLGLTRAWLALVAAELLAADNGLGQMMEMGRQMFRIDVVMCGVIVAGLIGFLLDRSVIAAEAYFTRWKRA